MKRCPVCTTPYPNSKTNCDRDRSPLGPPTELDPGTVVNNTYEIICTIGAGGFGVVYKACHIQSRALRAIKFLSPRVSHDPKILKRFIQEACIDIIHPNIVRIYDSAYDDGSPFIPMEYVNGPGLRELVGRGGLAVDRALTLTRGIALGLDAAHRRHILHRDIKPDNILIAISPGMPEIPKILDFGIAAVEDSAVNITRTRGQMFTPEYAAPEQWLGMPADEMDGRVDLYSLGVVLYEMLTGETDSRSRTSDGRMYSNLDGQRLPPSHLRPEVADWPGLDDLVMRMLAREREDRPASAFELVSEVDDVLRKTPVRRPVRLETVTESGVDVPSTGTGPNTTDATRLFHAYGEEQEKKGAGIRFEYVVLALILLASLSWAGYLGWRWLTQPTPGGVIVNPTTADQGSGTDGSDSGTGTGGGGRTKTVNAPPAPALLTVTCDIACEWSVNGGPKRKLAAGQADAVAPPTGTAMTLVAEATGERLAPKTRRLSAHLGERLGVRFEFMPELEEEQRQQAQSAALRSTQIESLIQQGDAKRQSGDDAGALREYNQALQLDPNNATANAKKADVLKECKILAVSCN